MERKRNRRGGGSLGAGRGGEEEEQERRGKHRRRTADDVVGRCESRSERRGCRGMRCMERLSAYIVPDIAVGQI